MVQHLPLVYTLQTSISVSEKCCADLSKRIIRWLWRC